MKFSFNAKSMVTKYENTHNSIMCEIIRGKDRSLSGNLSLPI